MFDRLAFACRVLRGDFGWRAPINQFPAFIPDENPLSRRDGSEARRNAALRMMDDDCYGFLLLTVHREAVGLRANIELAQHLQRSWLPAVSATLERVSDEMERVLP